MKVAAVEGFSDLSDLVATMAADGSQFGTPAGVGIEMVRVAFFGILLIAVGAFLTAFIMGGDAQLGSGADGRYRRRRHRRPGSMPRGLLGVLGVGAAIVAIVLAATVGDGWSLLPILLWLVVFVGLVCRAVFGSPRGRTPSVGEELGEEGAELFVRAETAVGRILSSAAARHGWLGEPADLDFKSDLAMISDRLTRARSVRGLMADLSALPRPTADDRRLLEEAQNAARRLEQSVRTRVSALEDCAEEATRIDRSLRAEEEQARFAKRRDDVRGRLRGMLAYVELSGEARPSDSADAVKARVGAYRELKGMIDEQRLGDDVSSDGRDSSKWLRSSRFQNVHGRRQGRDQGGPSATCR